MGVLENEKKKCVYIYFLGSFSSSINERRKKKPIWQLNGLLPNCVTIQWKLYSYIVVWKAGLALGGGGGGGGGGNLVTIQILYHGWGGLNDREDCIAIHHVVS